MNMPAAKKTSKRKFRNFICSVCGCECRFQVAAFAGRQVFPCPGCGWFSEEPIQNRRAQLHLIVAAAASIVFVGLVVAGFVGLGIPTWCLLAGIAGLACVVAQGAIAVWDPNRNLEKNVSVAEGLVAQGVIRDVHLPARKPSRPDHPTHGLGWARTGLLATAALCVGAMVTAELVRKHHGWIFNRELGVIGPGDSFTVSFENDTPSLDGRWSGEPLDPQIVLPAQHNVAIEGVTSATQTQKWGDEIRSSSSEQAFSPWSTISLPAREELSWRQVTLEVGLEATYPEQRGRGQFVNLRRRFHKTVHVTLSDPNAGHSYKQIWKFSGLGGAFVLLLASFGLAADRTGSTG